MTEPTTIPFDLIPFDDGAATDPDLAPTVSVLQRALVRFHPSFGFEERLAAQLRAQASADLDPARPRGRLIVFPPSVSGRGGDASADRRTRGLLLGGAIASGVIASAVSIAGAALLAWRRARVEQPWERLS